MNPEEKINETLYNNISYAMVKFEDALRQLNEGMALLNGAQLIADEIRKKENA